MVITILKTLVELRDYIFTNFKPSVESTMLSMKHSYGMLFSKDWNPDVLMAIFRYFIPKDLINVSMVCKSWYLCGSQNILWKRLVLKHFPGEYGTIDDWKEEFKAQLITFRIRVDEVSTTHLLRMRHRHWMMCGVHMFHPVNGRRGFDLLKPDSNLVEKKPSLETMIQMLKREDELRLSPEIQKLFANPGFDTIHVAEEVQKQVVNEFGFENMEESLSFIRTAPLLYPESPEVCKIPHYMKFNRSKQGELNVGDTIPNSKLAHLDGVPIDLHKYIDSQLGHYKPIIINAGSYT